MFPLFATGVINTGGKFAAGVVDTGGNLQTVFLRLSLAGNLEEALTYIYPSMGPNRGSVAMDYSYG